MSKKERMYQRITEHGRQLLAVFPDAAERDPIALCRKLRRWESIASRGAVDACNNQIGLDAWPSIERRVLSKVNALLGTERVWINSDPRGYSLKVDLTPGENLYTDWGGLGIIAPDLSDD